MKTIKVIAEITYDDEIICDESDPDQYEWLMEMILGDDNLMHNNDMGDTFGDIKILEILDGEEIE